MGKQSRRPSRRERFKAKPPKTEKRTNYDFDLTQTQITDLVSVKLDSAENQLAIELNLPVHGGIGYAAYEEVIDFDEQDVPGYLIDAARRLYEATVRAVRERVYTEREVPCATCTGNCCGRQFSSVRLTAEDIERMVSGGVKVYHCTSCDHSREEHDEKGRCKHPGCACDSYQGQIIMYDEVSFSGYAGEFNLIPWFDDMEQNACPNLTPEGCSIYEHRPLICREYSPWDCDIYEADPDKVEGKVKHKLKVVE